MRALQSWARLRREASYINWADYILEWAVMGPSESTLSPSACMHIRYQDVCALWQGRQQRVSMRLAQKLMHAQKNPKMHHGHSQHQQAA